MTYSSTINCWWRSYETSDIAKVAYQIFNAEKDKNHDPEKHTAEYLKDFPLLPKPLVAQFEVH